MKKSELKTAFSILGYMTFYEEPIAMNLYEVCKLISWDYFIGALKPNDESSAEALQTVRTACAEFNERGWFEFSPE